MKVLKFGGSSLKTSERINNVIDIIFKQVREMQNGNFAFPSERRKQDSLIAKSRDKNYIAVVVSAVGGVTDELIQLATIASKSQDYSTMLKRLESKHIALIHNLIKNQKQNYAIAMVQEMINELDEILNNVFDAQNASLKNLDLIMSFGERFSAIIMSQALKVRGINAKFLDARGLITTNEHFGKAEVDYKTTQDNIKHYFQASERKGKRQFHFSERAQETRPPYFKHHTEVPVITGFIALSDKGNTTTLGRGGSDYTAALFSAILGADELEIWTDVDGVMTADPKKVMSTRSIENMSYEEAMEMSSFGAKVLYPPTIQPAREKKIPIRIKNSFNSQFKGTLISQAPSYTRITGISSIERIALLRIDGAGMIGVAGVAQRLFGALAQNNISVILISQASSEHSICCAIESQFANKAEKEIEKEFAYEIHHRLVDKVVIEDDVLIIAVVGENMRKTPGVSGKLFQALGNKGVNVTAIAQGSSERNISIVINKHDELIALNTIHNVFFSPPLLKQKWWGADIFLVGIGNIGSALLRQIKNNTQNIRVIGIANSKTMIFNNDGISLSRWRKEFKTRGEIMNMNRFVKKIRLLTSDVNSKGNSIFVDCTASKEVVAYYHNILQSGISIVTPNKIANSGKYTDYERFRETARKNGVKFLYETNVGAGLPIISTINNLILSGDKILKIEAILSGTLSYIFNSFIRDLQFSEVVNTAKEKGYTEPDPRNDLNGMDVARKLLILARELGWSIELEDITVENLMSYTFQKIRSVDVFLKRLSDLDPYFKDKQKQAEDRGKVLRYIACLENKKACVSLQEIDDKHPFYNLSGSDNIVSITSKYYNDQPLVIKGPGAGPEITAAGALQDIIKTVTIT